MLQVQPSSLQVANAALPTEHMRTFKLREITACGIWPQTNKTYTRFCNAVPLVWGSLRLARITEQTQLQIEVHTSARPQE